MRVLLFQAYGKARSLGMWKDAGLSPDNLYLCKEGSIDESTVSERKTSIAHH